MRLGSRAGVTLMELIIAISLLSLLSVGLLMAMRVGLNAMEKSNNRIMANRRVSGAQRGTGTADRRPDRYQRGLRLGR